MNGARARVFIGVGSNLEPERHVPRALELLAERAELVRVSTFYRNAALNRPEQPDFLNGVVCIHTDIEPHRLKSDVLRDIERQLGRRRTADKYAARSIDLDILLYGDAVWADEELTVPDPDIRERPFLAVPLLELAPDLILPDSGVPLATLPVVRHTEGLRPDVNFTRILRLRLGHESGSCGGTGA